MISGHRKLQFRAGLGQRLVFLSTLFLPLPAAAAEAPGGGSALLLAGGLLVALGVAAFFGWRARQLAGALAEQREQATSLSRSNQELEAQLQQQALELEQRLNEQLEELAHENEELTEATAKLRKLVVVDEVTGLANRSHFDQVLPHEIKRALREEKPLSIILGRFDWADAFRNSYGKARFEEALVRIAEEVRAIFRRAGDLPARYDDVSFGIIFTSDGDVAVRFAERLRKAVWNIPIPHDASETADRVTFSIGVATIEPNKVHDPAEFRGAAEKATAIATDKGGNHVEDFRKPTNEPSPV